MSNGTDQAEEPVALAGRSGFRHWRLLGVALLLVALGIVGGNYYFGKRQISSSGGLFFFTRIDMPHFAQGDPRWAAMKLGPADSTMGGEGCAVSSAAMVLAYYGMATDPGRLNEFLSTHSGYTPQGWLYWEKAAEASSGLARHVYEDLPSHFLIDENLLRKNPVIIRLRLPSGVTHFVVIAGKNGFDYLINDPATAGGRGLYPLAELTRQIEALRYYEKI